MGLLMESLVGSLAGRCSGVGRGSPRPLQGSARYITPSPGEASSSVIFPWAASYRSRASVYRRALSGSHVGCA
jgi:hypothetical protein